MVKDKVTRKSNGVLARLPGRYESSSEQLGITRLSVKPLPGRKGQGILRAGSLYLRCTMGASGICADKREGDKASPLGRFRLIGGFFRADRAPRRACRLSIRALRCEDAWCDELGAGLYNRPFNLLGWTNPPGHENLWRPDHVYDQLIILDHNHRPRCQGRGSAIFFHLTDEIFRPTAGCIALNPDDMRRLLPRLAKHCFIEIG